MPAAQAGDEISVHQARVASRRLREALPVLGARADEDALDRAQTRVRRITRALGPVRELDVTLLLLAELEGKGAAPARAIARVRKAVIEERLKRRREMLDEITPSRLDKLRKRLVRVAAPDRERTADATRWPKRPRSRRSARASCGRRSSAPAASISPIACIACASKPRSCATRSRFSASSRSRARPPG